MRSRLGVLAFAVGLMFVSVSHAELFPGDDPNEVFIIRSASVSHADDAASAAPAGVSQAEPVADRDEDEMSAVAPAEPSTADAAFSPESVSACEAKLFSFSFRTGGNEALVAMRAKHSVAGEILQSDGVAEFDPWIID